MCPGNVHAERLRNGFHMDDKNANRVSEKIGFSHIDRGDTRIRVFTARAYSVDGDARPYDVSDRSDRTGAFPGCSFPTSVSVTDTVTTIGNYILHGRNSLESVSIPASVTEIGNGLIRSHLIERCIFGGSNPDCSSIDEVLSGRIGNI